MFPEDVLSPVSPWVEPAGHASPSPPEPLVGFEGKEGLWVPPEAPSPSQTAEGIHDGSFRRDMLTWPDPVLGSGESAELPSWSFLGPGEGGPSSWLPLP